jgi:serine/threonine-protein kinase
MIGSVIGTYRILDKIGEGGMGTVYRGVDVMLDREVAVKVLKADLLSNQQLVERFRTEAVLLAKLNHPNIATLYGFLPVGNQFAMVMEFLRGTPLDSMIERQGPIPVETAVRLFGGILDAIGHAHRNGIVHRDIKPSNIIILADGTPKVMDFGIARALGSSHQTRAGAIVGTLEYMSPEQIKGQETDGRSDIYSLGVLLFEMLTGRVPFSSQSEYELLQAHIHAPAPTPRIFGPHIPETVAQVVLRALAKEPALRFQTAEEFKAALNGQPVAVPAFAGVPNGYADPGVVRGTRVADVPVAQVFSQPAYYPPQPVFSPPTPVPNTPLPLPPNSGQYEQPAPRSILKPLVWLAAGGAVLLLVAAVGVFFWIQLDSPKPAPATVSQPAVKTEPKAPPATEKPTPAKAEPVEPTQPNFPSNDPEMESGKPNTPAGPTSPANPPADKGAPPKEDAGAKGADQGKAQAARSKRKGTNETAADVREKKRKKALKALDQ